MFPRKKDIENVKQCLHTALLKQGNIVLVGDSISWCFNQLKLSHYHQEVVSFCPWIDSQRNRCIFVLNETRWLPLCSVCACVYVFSRKTSITHGISTCPLLCVGSLNSLVVTIFALGSILTRPMKRYRLLPDKGRGWPFLVYYCIFISVFNSLYWHQSGWGVVIS